MKNSLTLIENYEHNQYGIKKNLMAADHHDDGAADV